MSRIDRFLTPRGPNGLRPGAATAKTSNAESKAGSRPDSGRPAQARSGDLNAATAVFAGMTQLSEVGRTQLLRKIQLMSQDSTLVSSEVSRAFLESVISEQLGLSDGGELDRLVNEVVSRMQADPELASAMKLASGQLVKAAKDV